MKKTTKLALLACLILLVSALMFTACKDKDNPSNNGEQTTPIVDEITTPEETTPAPHVHTVVIDNGVPPSCTEAGLTEGKHCNVCKVVLVKQEIVEATGHNFGDDLICDVCQFEKEADEISFKTLQANGTSVSGTVSNDTTVFSFIDEVAVSGKATYIVSLDIYGMQPVITKTVSLESGDNTFYILEQIDTEITFYTVTIRRRPMYKVTFDTNGGTAVASQSVEEGMCAALPETTTKHGYNFVEWMYDFSEPITSNITISAKWAGKTYTVKYDPDGDETLNNLTVTYGADYVLETPEKEGYTFEGWFDGETKYEGGKWNKTNDITLSPKWKINSYDVATNVNPYQYCGDVSGAGSYQFGSTVTVVAETKALGYTWLGWFGTNNTILSSDQSYEFILGASNTELEARWKISDEMSDFIFTSSDTTCLIQAVCDTTKASYIIPEYVTAIGQNAFSGCTNMTSITIPDSISSIGVGAFSGCCSLENITLPFVGDSVKTEKDTYQYPFGYIFGTSSYTGGVAIEQYYWGSNHIMTDSGTYYIPSSLKSVTITGGNILHGAFTRCSSLTSITIPNSVTSIGNYAFSGCSSLTSILIPDSVTSIGMGAFSGCVSLTNTTIPANVTLICSNAFKGCTGLTAITIPNAVKRIGMSAFYNCTGLTSITLPFVGEEMDGTTNTYFGYIFGALSSSGNGYYVPTTLKTVVITSGTGISSSAFANCSNLTSIIIPNSVTSIGDYAFRNCSSLTNITFEGTVAQWNAIKLGADWKDDVLATEVVCSDGVITLN